MNGKLHKILFAFIAAFLLVAVVMDIVIKDKKATAIIPDYTIESESETETETEREPETETQITEDITETQTTASDKKAYYEVVFECINSLQIS